MSHLHPEHWRELAPEFEARTCLLAAEETLSEAVDTAPVARALQSIRHTLTLLHPVTQNAEAAAEYEARKAGTYEPPQGSTGQMRRQDVDAKAAKELQELRALVATQGEALAKLTAAGDAASAETKSDKKKPA